MITPEELIQDLIDFYGYEVDLLVNTLWRFQFCKG